MPKIEGDTTFIEPDDIISPIITFTYGKRSTLIDELNELSDE